MGDEQKVWIRERKTKSGKSTYHLRWIDPVENRWKSRKVKSRDQKRIQREAATLEKQLAEGTYHEVRKVTWTAFVAEHVATLPGKWNAAIAERVLTEFGKECGIGSPKAVTFASIERYVAFCRKQERSQATVNKALRYIRAAMNKAVRRNYLAKNPMLGWKWDRPDEKAIRVVTDKEETALLAKAEKRYGQRFKSFIQVALGTGGRRGELVGLGWNHIDLDAKAVTFTATKGKRDRRIPILDDLVPVLKRVQAQTQQQAGPFADWTGDMVAKMFELVATDAKIDDVTLHDLRRTYITRLIRAGAALPTVQKLAGHASITTTLWYYNQVNDDDLRAGVAKLAEAKSCHRSATEPKNEVG